MEKRALIAIILSFLVIYIFEAYFLPKPQKQTQKSTTKVNKTEKKVNKEIKTKPSPQTYQSTKVALSQTPSVEKVFTIENQDIKGQLFIPGAGLREFYLKKYRVSVKKNSPPVRLIGKRGSFIWEVDVNGTRHYYFPFNVFAGARQFILRFSNGNFSVTDVVHYDKKGYVIFNKFFYKNETSKPVDLKVALNLYYKITGETSRYYFKGALIDHEGKLKKIKLKEVHKKGKVLYSGDVRWAGFSDRYFLQAVLLPSPGALVTVTGDGEKGMIMRVQLLDEAVDPGKVIGENVRFYLGPEKLSILKDVGGDLHIAVDFGIWGIIARPILALLNLFNLIFHNYGISIILLTILIKLLFYPLTLKSYQSMAKLKELQPLMEEIKKKYADDKERMNKELMELYRKYKVNPMGGCLPTLLQLPIFIALYYVLLRAIELRHAYFFLWINDLSAADNLVTLTLGGFHLPIRVLPLLMGITMYLQQKLSPTGMDKSQQMIFALLPLIFTFLFYGLPSGLMLYWTTNNLISIYQQVRINKVIANKPDEKQSKQTKPAKK